MRSPCSARCRASVVRGLPPLLPPETPQQHEMCRRGAISLRDRSSRGPATGSRRRCRRRPIRRCALSLCEGCIHRACDATPRAPSPLANLALSLQHWARVRQGPRTPRRCTIVTCNPLPFQSLTRPFCVPPVVYIFL
ncbi:hypothetical protein pneo_cds_481 [Pandoravirus neocaledonia]|uniref:Uncharacterized protein n=1 Tax=Pandoravirus neocaledonia TaxID=2107708 RepID=A0A2U7UC93_9VIRU|nr:hypothetical protein pneo_cds_481 [Pandoravirus neocaledonia]AVK76088.1 hypothetical protein pneo_cds_481 [Pandoravirus neocaledonia]